MGAKDNSGHVNPEEFTHTLPSSTPMLTAKALLHLSSLKTMNCSDEASSEGIRKNRLNILKTWHKESPSLLSSLLLTEKGVDPKTGCFPLHWMAGTGFDEAVRFTLDHYSMLNSEKGNKQTLVNQYAKKPSTGRTPLHYAARNAHVGTCKLLIETCNADPNPKCHRGSVTPLQLAVWQNNLPIVEYLISINGRDVVLEKNDFHCGLNHWIGLIPKHRWLSSDGTGVLPLAQYLESCGLSYTSAPENQQNQGHSPLHKAAWGGNIALMEYFRKRHSVADTVQDSCGNYAADLAGMGGNMKAQEWLYQHGSLDRKKSCAVLGVDATATNEEIHTRYKQLAKTFHPDRQRMILKSDSNTEQRDDEFLKIKAAYEHLIHQGGVGSQANPKYEALKLLAASDPAIHETPDGDDDLFHARILAIISDYGDRGFPISAIAKRWNQIWPDRPFPSPEEYIIDVPTVLPRDGSPEQAPTTVVIQKRVKLLKFLKHKCRGIVTFRKIDGVERAFQTNKQGSNS